MRYSKHWFLCALTHWISSFPSDIPLHCFMLIVVQLAYSTPHTKAILTVFFWSFTGHVHLGNIFIEDGNIRLTDIENFILGVSPKYRSLVVHHKKCDVSIRSVWRLHCGTLLILRCLQWGGRGDGMLGIKVRMVLINRRWLLPTSTNGSMPCYSKVMVSDSSTLEKSKRNIGW